MNAGEKRKAVFLDRDGTLIEEVNFLSRVEDLRIFPFTMEALSLLKAAGYLIIVVTNQSGIGRGIYDTDAMHAIHDGMQVQLDGIIDAFYFCPHLPCDGCECRKPGLGMIQWATFDNPIDLANSWMIGDKKIDVETAHNAGMKSAMVLTGYGRAHSKSVDPPADVTAEDLLAAVRAILQ
jgi:D-glycero-D-manno-heptose 1,7-bisphosphate phosphatase